MEFRLIVPHAINADTDPSAGMLRSPAVDGTARSPINTISVGGRSWALSDTFDLDGDSTPEYTCISYRWGSDRQEHALFPNKSMSTRVIPSLATAMESRRDRTAFWTDVFCVPSDEGPSRQATLENMSYIYARAAEVVVVLDQDTFAVLQEVIQHRVVSEEKLQVLESDSWVTSVWTYQELVNAADVHFVSERLSDDGFQHLSADAAMGDPRPSITGSELLDALGHGLLNYQQSHASDAFAVANRFPNLNVLETVLVDWMMGSFTRYAALTIFSSLYHKRNENAANYYYSIMGVLSDCPHQLIWSPDQASETLAERLMKMCEQKSDFSFIYSVADRDTNPGKRWRPREMALPRDGEGVPAMLRPIMAWHFYGEAQGGTLDENGALTLHQMTIMYCADPPRMSDVARVAIHHWLGGQNSTVSDDDALSSLVYTSIRLVGFEGEANSIVVPDGLVFTLHSIDRRDIVDILISNQIRFSQGAPGLVRYQGSGHENVSYSPCLFVGAIDLLLEPGQSVLL